MLIGAFSILLSAVVLLSYLISKIPQLGETGIWISIPISWFWQTPPELFITLPQKKNRRWGVLHKNIIRLNKLPALPASSIFAKKHLLQKSFFLMKIDPSRRLFYFDYKNYAARFDFISR